MSRANILSLAIVSIGLTSISVGAAPLLYDGFSGYTAGAMAGQVTPAVGYASGGSWVSLAGTVSASPSSGLTYSQGSLQLVTSGGLAETAVAGFNGVKALLDVSPAGPFAQAGLVDGGKIGGTNVSGTLYYSFLAKVLATDLPDGSNDFAGFQLYNGGSEGLGVGNNWNAWAFSTFGPGGEGDLVRPSDNTYLLVDSATHLFVVKIQFNAGGNDDMTIYMDPSLADVEANQPNTVWRRSATGNAMFDGIALRSGSSNNDNSWQFDEVRFGTSWNDVVVVPEPAGLGLAAIGALGLLARRRRA